MKDTIQQFKDAGEEQKAIAMRLADALSSLSDDRWSLSFDKDDGSISFSLRNGKKEVDFIVIKNSVIWLKMDEEQHPPLCKSGFNPDETMVLDLIIWVKERG